MSGNSRKTNEELNKWCMMLYGIQECHVVVCCAISIYFSPVWCHLMIFLPKLSAADARRKVRRWVSQFVEGYEHMPWCQISRLTWDPRDCQWRTTSWSWFCRLPVWLSFCEGRRHKLQLAPPTTISCKFSIFWRLEEKNCFWGDMVHSMHIRNKSATTHQPVHFQICLTVWSQKCNLHFWFWSLDVGPGCLWGWRVTGAVVGRAEFCGFPKLKPQLT